MFERLVVSTSQRRQRRTLKFFVWTSLIYLSVVGVAFALSVVLATPKLADTSPALEVRVLPIGSARNQARDKGPAQTPPTHDLRNPDQLENIIRDIGTPQPTVIQTAFLPRTEAVGEGDLPPSDGPGIPGGPLSTARGAISGEVTTDPPRPPDPPKPQPRTTDKAKPLPVSSVVLQGKAIDRALPIYPELPRRIGLQGAVSVEVIISPEGRVESVRVVSGHPMLVQSAMDAARRWRFEATLLNGVAVRVTGVITFVFKINQ